MGFSVIAFILVAWDFFKRDPNNELFFDGTRFLKQIEEVERLQSNKKTEKHNNLVTRVRKSMHMICLQACEGGNDYTCKISCECHPGCEVKGHEVFDGLKDVSKKELLPAIREAFEILNKYDNQSELFVKDDNGIGFVEVGARKKKE